MHSETIDIIEMLRELPEVWRVSTPSEREARARTPEGRQELLHFLGYMTHSLVGFEEWYEHWENRNLTFELTDLGEYPIDDWRYSLLNRFRAETLGLRPVALEKIEVPPELKISTGDAMAWKTSALRCGKYRAAVSRVGLLATVQDRFIAPLPFEEREAEATFYETVTPKLINNLPRHTGKILYSQLRRYLPEERAKAVKDSLRQREDLPEWLKQGFAGNWHWEPDLDALYPGEKDRWDEWDRAKKAKR